MKTVSGVFLFLFFAHVEIQPSNYQGKKLFNSIIVKKKKLLLKNTSVTTALLGICKVHEEVEVLFNPMSLQYNPAPGEVGSTRRTDCLLHHTSLVLTWKAPPAPPHLLISLWNINHISFLMLLESFSVSKKKKAEIMNRPPHFEQRRTSGPVEHRGACAKWLEPLFKCTFVKHWSRFSTTKLQG